MIYQLLGYSDFAGFVMLILVQPLNPYMSRRSIRIQKSSLAARDKRMGVLNELLGAVSILFNSSPRELKGRLIVSLCYLQIKLIKFLRWKDR